MCHKPVELITLGQLDNVQGRVLFDSLAHCVMDSVKSPNKVCSVESVWMMLDRDRIRHIDWRG